MSQLPISIPPKTLAQSISASASSFKLNNIEGWDGVDLVTADLGTQHFVTFKNSTGTLLEIMEIDPATIASASITILKRGLKFNGDETEVTANKLAWSSGETIVQLGTDVPQLLNNFVDKGRAQTITGVKTFSAVPASSAAPVSGTDLVNKTYADALSIGVTKVDQLIVAATAGETVSAGQLLYFDLTDNEWKKCDADTAALIDNVMLGIAQGAGVNGGAISGGVLTRGVDTNQSGMTQGDLMYASNTAGGISASAGTTERVIGIARSTTNLFFDPDFYYIPTALQKAAYPTAGQKAAMAGTVGTPAATNAYVTDDQVINATGTDQTQTTQNATVEVGEADATTKKNKLAQSFVAAEVSARGVALYKSANTGTFTGTVTIAIYSDSAGSPNASLISTTITNAAWLLIPTGAFEISFATDQTLAIGTTYWIVITTSTSDNSNHPNMGTNSAGGYGSGSVKYNNVTDSWVAVATIDLYFKVYEGVKSRIPKSDSTSGLIPPVALPYSFVEMNTTDSATVASSTTETTVYTGLLPAGFFTLNSGLKLRSWLICQKHTTDYQTLKIYLNDTVVLTIEITNADTNSNNIEFGVEWEAYILNNASLSAQKNILLTTLGSANGMTTFANQLTYSAQSASNIGRASGFTYQDGTSAVNTAGLVVVRVTLANNISHANTQFRHHGIIVEKIG